jgi:hypothetical protein
MLTRLRRHLAVVRSSYELDADIAAMSPQRCAWCRDATIAPGEGLHTLGATYCSQQCEDGADQADRQAY